MAEPPAASCRLSVPRPAAPRHPLPGFRVPEPPERVRDESGFANTGPEPRKPRNSVRATVAAADFGGAVCNVECMFGMTGWQRLPAVGSPWFYQMVAPIFPPRRTDRNSRPSRGRSGSRPRSRCEIGAGLQESAAVYAVENVVGGNFGGEQRGAGAVQVEDVSVMRFTLPRRFCS